MVDDMILNQNGAAATMRSLCFAVAIFFVSQVATASQLLQDVSSLGDGAACTNLVESVKSQLQFENIDVPAQHTAGQRYAGTLYS